jgi:outer membrane protein OmpA-like peptidoglycan-associated protein/tetratricopeptide (TPR) repeat protein
MKTMHKILFCAFALALLNPIPSRADAGLKKADKLYDNLLYEDAIPEYMKAFKEDPDNSKTIFRLAHCYRMTKNTLEAERWYAAAVHLKDAPASQYLYYSECLITNGKYAEAERWVKKYVKAQGVDERARKVLQRLANINALMEDSLNFNVKKISINSGQSDFGPVVYNNGIVFASARENIENEDKKHVKSDEPFYYLYYARGTDDNFKKPEVFAPTVFTKYNNGPICFNKEGNEFYVTRNNVEDNKVKASDGGVVNLKIYRYKKTKTDWNGETSFPYNSDNYSCAHAFLSADGNKLYFSSDMPGGYGKSDIYVCTRKGTKWNKPENLGPEINSAESEGYPFEDEKGGLFFSSNGRGGLGGFDIFYAKKLKEGYDTPVNVGYPINSSSDDFGWVQNETGTNGYFTSNRGDRDNNDDIYCFLRMRALLNVLVYDSDSNTPLAESTVRVIESGKEKKVVKTSKNGYVNIYMDPNKSYRLLVENQGYVSDSIKLNNDGTASSSAAEIPVAMKYKKSELDVLANAKKNSTTNNHPDEIYYFSNSSGIAATAPPESSGESRARRSAGKNTGDDGEEDTGATEPNSTYSDEYGDAANSNPSNSPAPGGSTNYRIRSDNSKGGVSTTGEANEASSFSKKRSNQKPDPGNDSYAMNERRASMPEPVKYGNGAVVRLDNIYYDINKHVIALNAQRELDIAVNILNANPNMKIELSSHTDCRESEAYNQTLSQERANEALIYLLRKGIAAYRITANGYGESRLVNHCECEGTNARPCTEKQHAANRRTEIKLYSE